jgi:hypothetical protein
MRSARANSLVRECGSGCYCVPGSFLKLHPCCQIEHEISAASELVSASMH